MLLEQGDDDRNVDFSSNVSLVRAVKSQKPSLDLQTRVLPNEQHEMYMRFEDLVEAYDTGGQWMLTHLLPGEVTAPANLGATVPATLSLTIAGPVSFGALTPGTAGEYSAATTASVTSTAGDASLSVADVSGSPAGHLSNGSFALANALQARATQGGGGSDAPFAAVGATPLSQRPRLPGPPVPAAFTPATRAHRARRRTVSLDRRPRAGSCNISRGPCRFPPGSLDVRDRRPNRPLARRTARCASW
jgi:hypothetical protein